MIANGAGCCPAAPVAGKNNTTASYRFRIIRSCPQVRQDVAGSVVESRCLPATSDFRDRRKTPPLSWVRAIDVTSCLLELTTARLNHFCTMILDPCIAFPLLVEHNRVGYRPATGPPVV